MAYGDSPYGTYGSGGGVAPTPLSFDSWVTADEAAPVLQPMGDDDDAYVIIALEIATSLVRDYLQCDYLQQVTTETYDGTGSSRMLLARGPINSITSISMTSNLQSPWLDQGVTSYYTFTPTVVPSTNITFDAKFVTLNGFTFCTGQNNISVTYDAGYVLSPFTGYKTMPRSIKHAIIITAKAIFMARAMDFNTSGENAAGAYSTQYLVGSLSGIPPSAQVMLNPYRRTAKW